MRILDLTLTNFRSHKQAHFDFGGNNTLIVGPNGSGKTNILEAIHLLSTTKSIKAAYDSEMIMHGCEYSRLEGTSGLQDDSQKLELVIKLNPNFEHGSTKTVKLNSVPKALNKFAGKLTSVLFSPDEISMLTGSPAGRRKYIDSIFFQTDLVYKKAHSEYQKALKGRNKLLETIRETGKGANLIELWEEKLAQTADIIQTKRKLLFDFFATEIKQFEKMVNGENVEIKVELLQSIVSTKSYSETRQKETYAGKTLYGPHRDDFTILLNGYSVAHFGSRGQQRAVLLALKLCEINFIQKCNNIRPVLLLDDIFSELDENHRKNVMSILGLQQTIITTSEQLELPKENLQTIELTL